MVFNLFEGEADRSETEIYNAALLEWARVRSPAPDRCGTALGRDKVRTKYLLQRGRHADRRRSRWSTSQPPPLAAPVAGHRQARLPGRQHRHRARVPW